MPQPPSPYPSPYPRPPGSVLTPVLALLACLALGAPGAAAAGGVALKRVAEGFVAPMVLTSLDDQRLLVADQVGVVHVLSREGVRRDQPFLDLRPRLTALNAGFDERGLLGLALHPDFARNRRLFVYYSAPRQASCPTNWDHTAHLSEFRVTADATVVDADSEKVLLRVDQPYFNHNGGRLAFGADGLLYLGLGDGGNGNDEGHDRSAVGNAQDLTTLLGKILRLDVDHPEAGRGYGIPKDNPLVGRPPARPEIFAWGIRNPWGLSVDRGGQRQIFAADVGQNRYEEINILRRGGNFGWNQREGRHPFDPKKPNSLVDVEAMTPSDRSAFVEPILEYKNRNSFPKDPDAMGISVTGGYVYRGGALRELQGAYVFADWSRQWAVPDGHLLVARPARNPEASGWSMTPLPLASHPEGKLGAYVLAFGEDAEGELYALTTQRAGLVDRTGAVWKLVPAP